MNTHSWSAIQSTRISHLPTEEDDLLVLERDTRIRERIVKSGKITSNEEGEHPTNPTAPEVRRVADRPSPFFNVTSFDFSISGTIGPGGSVTITAGGGSDPVQIQRATQTHPTQEVPIMNSIVQNPAGGSATPRADPPQDLPSLPAGVSRETSV